MSKFRLDDLSERKIKLILYICIFLFLALLGVVLNIPPVLDEVGTMANSAFLAGYDWKRCVVSMGSFYYKYGTVVLYAPIFAIFEDSYIIYKAIMVVHAALMAFIPVISYVILRRHLKVDSIRICVFISVAVGLLPSALLYSLYARADVVMIFIAWPLCLLLLEAWRAGQEGNWKKQQILSISLGALAVYAYMAHSRGIVFVIAVFLTSLIIQFIMKKKVLCWTPYLITTSALLIIDKFIANYFIANVYGKNGPGHANVEAFDFEMLKFIFSEEGLDAMFKMVFGWLYNVVVSTYGMVIIGILAACVIIFAMIKKQRNGKILLTSQRNAEKNDEDKADHMDKVNEKNVTPEEAITSVFGLLSFLGVFALGCLFFFPVIYNFCTGVKIERSDRLIYGRYTVSGVGILLMIALYLLFVKRKTFGFKTKLSAVVSYIVVTGLCIWNTAPLLSQASVNFRYLISLCTFIETPSWGTTVFKPEEDSIVTALLLAGILALIIFIVILLLTARHTTKRNIATAGLIIAFSLTVFFVNYIKLRVSRDSVLVTRTEKVVEFIKPLSDIDSRYMKILCDESKINVRHYQFILKEFYIGNLRSNAKLESDTFVLCDKYPDDTDLYQYYRFKGFDYDTDMDMVFIRGEGLKAELESKGYKLVLYKRKK